MRIELVNQSKYRTGSRPGDDVPLIVPGQIFGVFDGATDARGTVVDGVGAGRLAALTVARDMACLAGHPDTRDLSSKDIVRKMSAALAARTAELGLPIPPSTTLAVALDCGAAWRFILLGDTGIRLNGTEILRRQKLIDEVSTLARVAVFNLLRGRVADLDLVERTTRRAIFLGLDQAVAENVVDRENADRIIALAIETLGLEENAETVATFLRGGIQTQFRFGNATGSPLCFDTLNGTVPTLEHLVDVERPKSDVRSIEIFSDGYPDLPGDVTTSAWEESFQRCEEIDFHKTGPFATVKGSTSDEFFDDRTVLVVSAI